MNLIMFSLDSNVCVPHSADHKRVLLYAKHFESVHIIVPAVANELLQFDGMHFHSIAKGNKVLLFFRLLTKGFSVQKQYLLDKKNTIITTQDPFELGLVGYLLHFFTGIALHVQVHIDFFNPYFISESLRQRIQATLANIILKRAQRVRVVSNKIAQYVATLGVPNTRIDIAPLFINFDAYGSEMKEAANVSNSVPYFLLAARFVKQKNIPLAIRAFRDVHRKYPKYKLRIIGSGGEEFVMKEIVHHFQLAGPIEIVPWVDNLQSEYTNAFAFVLSSNYEGWGRTCVESSICNTPVIMTNVGCANELLFNKQQALIVPVNNQQALRDAMLELIENEQLYTSLKKELLHIRKALPTSENFVKEIVFSWKNTLTFSS